MDEEVGLKFSEKLSGKTIFTLSFTSQSESPNELGNRYANYVLY